MNGYYNPTDVHSIYFFYGDVLQKPYDFIVDEQSNIIADKNDIFVTNPIFNKKTVRNTWDDWHIVATERPSFKRPTRQTHYVDVPGMSGSLDFSDQLTGYPTYEDREGTFKFYADNDAWTKTYCWMDLHEEIAGFLDRKELKAILQDDTAYFYQGKFQLSDYKAGKTFSEFTIKYKVNPYKWSVLKSTDDWLWDPFCFPKDTVQKKLYHEVPVVSDDDWQDIPIDFKSTRSRAPISPEFNVSSYSGNGMAYAFTNPDLGISVGGQLSDGLQFVPALIITGDRCTLKVKGKGKITVDFRRGEL